MGYGTWRKQLTITYPRLLFYFKKYSPFKPANVERARLCTLIGRRTPGNKSAFVNEVLCLAPTLRVAIRLSLSVFRFNCKHERMCKGLRPWVVHVQWGCIADEHSTCLNGVGSLNVIHDALSGQWRSVRVCLGFIIINMFLSLEIEVRRMLAHMSALIQVIKLMNRTISTYLNRPLSTKA